MRKLFTVKSIATVALLALIGGPAAMSQTGSSSGSSGTGTQSSRFAKPRLATGNRAPIRCRRKKIWAIRTIRSTRKTPRSTARSRAFAAAADQPLRAASAIPIRDAPPNSRLMPTNSPMAQSAEPGKPAMMIAAISKSIIPATSNQDQRSDNSRRCSSAYMIVATPSARK